MERLETEILQALDAKPRGGMEGGVPGRGWWAVEQEGWGKKGGGSDSVSQVTGPLLELSHEVILFYAVVGAKGDAGGSREEMMFAQERDNEAKELSMLDVGSGEKRTQDGPFKKGRGFHETVVSRVTTRIPKLAP